MKKIVGVLVAVFAVSLMAAGVQAADKYSVGTVPADDQGGTCVPINVEADSNGTDVNGYIIRLTYDSTKVSPVKYGSDDLEKDCYAEAGTGFDAGNSILVSDVISADGDNKTLVVAWAGAAPVHINANQTQEMAEVKFVKANTSDDAVDQEVPIKVELAALTNDGSSTVDVNSAQVEVADGEIVVGKYGDINNDTFVDAFDAGLALKHAASDEKLLTVQQIKIGDVNADGHVDAFDAGLILKHSVSMGEYIFPVEQQ